LSRPRRRSENPEVPPRRTADTRIGISGWRYGPWRGTFYPKGLAQRRELEYASRQINSIEINGSFYSLQRPEFYRQWYDETPDGFVFSLKGGRYITHMLKLRNVEGPLANFFASGPLCLKEKMGPILWQFPPQMGFIPERFEAFFQMLPRDTEAAAKLARGHDERLNGRSWTKTDAKRPIRYAVEIRHASFETPQWIDLLWRHGIALCLADTAGRWPYAEDMTADFVYARLHGDEELYVSGYSDSALDWWAARLKAWRAGLEPPEPKRLSDRPAKKVKTRDVFVYFDNDVKVRAPFDAMNLARRLGACPETSQACEPPKDGQVTELPRERWPGLRGARRMRSAAGSQRRKPAK
jgi:uncharacterized protein YecE (DUF72 family)